MNRLSSRDEGEGSDEREGSRLHLAVRRRSRIHADSLILRLSPRQICDQV
jgi:hypothetical protein